MTSERIVVRIDPAGQIHAETIGMKGQKCLDAIAMLEDLVDAETTSSSFTPEYYEVSNTSTFEVDDELRHR